MSRWRLTLVLLLALGGAALSGLLLLDHHGVELAEEAVSQLCGPPGESGCEQVARSRYSSMGGISLAAMGLFFYLSVLLLGALGLIARPETRRAASSLILLSLGLAVVIDVVLLGLQAFSIGAFCSLCLWTYGINGAALVTLLPARTAVGELGHVLRQAELRMALAGWALGTVALGLSVGAAELAFGERDVARQATLLGSPAPAVVDPPAPEPEPTPPEADPEPPPEPEVQEAVAVAEVAKLKKEFAEELRRAHSETRRLQEILDDPQKLQQYQAEKAAREFDRATPEDLDLTRTPFKGPADAPIRVVEYSDFLCPYCRSLAGAFRNYLPRSANRVAIYFKNYPLDQDCNPELNRTVHPGACELALGAICAHEQGRFWLYHDKVFAEEPKNPSLSDIIRLGGEVGLDGPALEACLASEIARQRLSEQIGEAKRVGVTATPTVFVNGKRLPRLNDFLQAIETEAGRLGLPPLRPPANQ